MADDFLDAIGVTAPSAPATRTTMPVAPARTYDPTDAAIRTVYGEASPNATKEEQQAIAAVIANRAAASGKPFDQVVQEPHQFEPWNNPKARARIDALKADDPAYQVIAANVQDVLSGKNNPYPTLTHFYAPTAQSALGRDKPSFDDGTGQQIGSTLFFAGKGGAPAPAAGDDDFLSTLGINADDAVKQATASSGAQAQMAGKAETGVNPQGQIIFQDTGKPIGERQSATYLTLAKGHQIDPNAPEGSINRPFVQRNPEDKFPEGAYYIAADAPAGSKDPGGDLRQMPGGPKESSLGQGVVRGVGDLVATVGSALPGVKDSALGQELAANRLVHDAKYGNDLLTGLGRFVGQATASAIPIAGTEVALAPALKLLGPTGEFIAGKAGLASLPEGAGLAANAGRLATRAASLGTKGAIEGATGAGLVSSASDEPLSEQLKLGALGGGVAGVAAPAVGNTFKGVGRFVKGLVEPLTSEGQGKMADRLIAQFGQGGPMSVNSGELVPGSVPTLAAATGNPGLASLERTLRLSKTNPFDGRDVENAAARVDFFDRLKGDEDTIKTIQEARDAATGKLRQQAFQGAGVADPTAAVEKIDEILKGPSGQRDVVTKALNSIRQKLNGENGPQTDVEQLYGIRKSIDDMLSPMASNDTKGSQLASRELLDVKKEIDGAIEKAAPGFKEYLKTYADMSKPLDEAQLLQSLKITDMRGNITLSRVNSAISKIEDMRKQGGVNKGKSVSADTMAQLQALREDLLRADQINRGRPLGSDTGQHLVTGNLASNVGVPLGVIGSAIAHHPIGGAALGLGRMFYGKKNAEVLDALTNRLLSPEAPQVVSAAATPKRVGALRRLGSPVLTTTSGVLSNRLLGSQ